MSDYPIWFQNMLYVSFAFALVLLFVFVLMLMWYVIKIMKESVDD